MIKQLTIIGLGLIGGSIARAIKPTGFCQTIMAYDQDPDALIIAKKSKIIDDYANSPGLAVKNADLIILATPLGKFPAILKAIKTNVNDKTIITDVGSVKESLINNVQQILGKKFANFVPGHPIAGSEKSGLAAANPDLFVNRLVILTPTATTNSAAIETVKTFWQQMQARVEIMDAILHDRILAATSHLPQMLAYTFMQDIAEKTYPNIFHYASSGLKDFTRLAGSSPAVWLDICLQNQALLAEINQFQEYLAALQQALQNQDRKNLLQIFTTANDARKKLLELV